MKDVRTLKKKVNENKVKDFANKGSTESMNKVIHSN